MERRNNFRKSIAFTLILTMLISTVSFGTALMDGGNSNKVYAGASDTATLRIEGMDGETILPETSGSIIDGVTTIGAFVADICAENNLEFQLSEWNYPATIGGINSFWMSYIDDSGSAFDTGNYSDVTMAAGNSVVLYPYANGQEYSYFEAGNPGVIESYGYYKASVPLSLYQIAGWPATKSPVEGATVTAIDATTYPEYSPTVVSDVTGSDGKVTLSLWAGTYLISAEKTTSAGAVITKPYAKVIVGNDGSTTIISPKTPDVNLEKLEIELPAATVNVKNQIDAGNPYINTTEIFTGITITAIAVSETATISVAQNDIAVNLTSGTATYLAESTISANNTFTIKVTNGEFSKNYTFYINKVAEAITGSALMSETETIIGATSDKGITYYNEYYPEYVTALYANGGALTDSGKAEFLADVLDDVRTSNTITSVGRLGKIAAALTAVGIDPRQVPDISGAVATGTTINLIEKISERNLSQYDSYNAPYMLIGYDSGNYTVASGTARTALIDFMISQQNDNGGFASSWPDTDTTALYIMAFAPYYNASGAVNGVSAEKVSQIKTSVEEALLYLQGQQNSYGCFMGFGGFTNSNSTSLVVSALAAINKDPNAAPYIKNGYSAVQGLLSYKTAEGLVGITDSVNSNNVSDVQGLMALVGYKKYVENRTGNIYEISGEPQIFTTWPSETLKEISIQRSAMTYKAGDSVLADQITVSGIFASSGGIRTEILLPGDGTTGYDISGNTNLKAGGNSITVTFLGKEITFVLTAINSDGTAAETATVNLSVKDVDKQTIVSDRDEPIEAGKTTVLDALRSVLSTNNIPYIISGGSYVSSINGISEFDGGPYSGWLYQVNGVTLPTTAPSEKILNGGENIIWYYTNDFTKDSSSSAWVNKEAAAAGTENVLSMSTEVNAKLDSSGNALATISASELATVVKKAIASIGSDGESIQTEIIIDVNMDAEGTSLETKVPKVAIGDLIANKIDKLTISSSLGDISFDSDTLKTIFSGAAGDVSINIKKAKELQGRPVIDLSIESNGTKISQFTGTVTVTVPYTLALGETASGIVVFYVNEQGKFINVKNSDYNEKTKQVTFKTDHFSEFIIKHNDLTFTDIMGHWSKSNIQYLAAREIIRGKAEGLFMPNNAITRAEFVTILGNKAGADFRKYSTSSFGDVKSTDWFAGAVAWAAEKGIVTGAEGKFKPNENISRQEMAVVLDRYMSNIEKSSAVGTNKAILFSDDTQIASYAKVSVAKMQQLGIINGKTETTFAPKEMATRGEAAKMLATFMKVAE